MKWNIKGFFSHLFLTDFMKKQKGNETSGSGKRREEDGLHLWAATTTSPQRPSFAYIYIGEDFSLAHLYFSSPPPARINIIITMNEWMNELITRINWLILSLLGYTSLMGCFKPSLVHPPPNYLPKSYCLLLLLHVWSHWNHLQSIESFRHEWIKQYTNLLDLHIKTQG